MRVEKALGLYREQYFDLNVRHFREKLAAEHQIRLSYTWVKRALCGSSTASAARTGPELHGVRYLLQHH